MDMPFFYDPAPIAAFQRLLGLGWPEPWRVIALLGTNWGILLVLGTVLWLWGRRAAYAVLLVVTLDALLKGALNRILYVPRPDHPSIVNYEHVSVGAFPSGHVMTAAALWGWLALHRRVGWGLAIAVTGLVASSRLYLGVHYVGDLLGAALLAAAVVWLAAVLWPRLAPWLRERAFALWMLLAALALAGVVAGAFFWFGQNPYRWRAAGLVAGLAIGLPLEWRWVRYRPGDVSRGRKAAIVAIGAAGIAVCAAADQVSGEASASLGLGATALAALWTVLIAPTLFARLGWSARAEPRREEILRRTARVIGFAVAALAALLLYGGAIEPRLVLDLEEHEARVPRLPPAWEGARIGVVSDFQLGMWLDNTGMMRRAVRAIVDAQPDAAILAGDFLYHPGGEVTARVREILSVLEPLARSGIPTFAVLGNHDWGLVRPVPGGQPLPEAARALRSALQDAGITVLHNSAAALPARGERGRGADPERDGDALWVVGAGSRYAHESDPPAALAAVPADAPRLAVMHNPASFPAFPAGTAPLAVAGHTHGGQARLPFTPQWSWLTFAAEDPVYADGWIEDERGEPGNRLYVTRGIGMSILPIRINCPPEVTFFTLRPAETGSPRSLPAPG